MNPKLDLSNLRIRILKKLKFGPKHYMSGSSAKEMIAKRSLKCWFGKAGDNEKLRFFYCRTESEKISGSGVVFHQSSACKRNDEQKGGLMELRSGRQFHESVERTAGM